MRLTAVFAGFALFSSSAVAQQHLQERIRDIAADTHGTVSVACSLPGTPLDCDLDPTARAPMQSVFKLPLVMAVLHQVEQGKFTLEQPIPFRISDLILPKPHSPLQDKYPHAGVEVPLRDLMQMTVTFSDNTAADMLLRLAGSPKVVNHYMASLGVTGFHLRDDERALHRKHDLQYRNWFEPRGAVQLLRRISDHSPLTAEHTALLLEWMSLPSGRLEANLPSGTRVFHKSGSSDVDEGIAGATNDIGLIALPDGRQLAIAVFVTDSRADSATRLQVIARMVTCLGDSFVSPVSLVIFHRREGSALHVIDVHGALQVIDLMLQDARVPTQRMNHALASVLVEAFDGDFARTRDHGHEACQA
jgi:beta-lactamase class A